MLIYKFHRDSLSLLIIYLPYHKQNKNESSLFYYPIKKEEIVFIDYTKKNVDEAIRLGINGIVVENA